MGDTVETESTVDAPSAGETASSVRVGEAEAPPPKVVRVIEAVESVVGGSLVVAILVLMILQVVSRRVLNAPMTWTEEVGRYALVWMTFVGAGLLMSRGGHVVVALFDNRLGSLGKRILEAVTDVFIAATCIVFIPLGLSYASDMGRIASPAAGIPMSIVYLASVVGLGLVAFHALVNAYLAIRYGRCRSVGAIAGL